MKLHCENDSSLDISRLHKPIASGARTLPEPANLSEPRIDVESKVRKPNQQRSELANVTTSNKIPAELTQTRMVGEFTSDKGKKVVASESTNGSSKPSFTSDKDCVLAKANGSGRQIETSETGERGISSRYRPSASSDVSDESSCSTMNSISKPHRANDSHWKAIQMIRTRDGILGLSHFKLLRKLGCGDIGSVYLSELSGTKSYFARNVMDKASLASRKKLLRAQTEKEILQCLDHPFLPTLYTHFETDKFSCLVVEFCPGGDLHTFRQRQRGKYSPEQAVKFYIAEILLALEYLHMLGIIYHDLKPENVLVREDGHHAIRLRPLPSLCSEPNIDQVI